VAFLDDAAHVAGAVAHDTAVVGGLVGDACQEGKRGAGVGMLLQEGAQRLGAHQRRIAIEHEDRVG